MTEKGEELEDLGCAVRMFSYFCGNTGGICGIAAPS